MRPLLLMTLVACGDPSSIDADTDPPAAPTLDVDLDQTLDELTADQWAEVCDWMIETQGGVRTEECGDGVSVSVQTMAECTDAPVLPACELALLVDCVLSTGTDICADATEPCAAFNICAMGG